MAEEKTLPPHANKAAAEAGAPAASDADAEKAIDPVKLAGGVVFFIASIALMLHRMPHIGYVEKHADKGKPTAAAAAPAPTPSKPAAPKVAAAPAPAKPAPVAAKPAPAPAPGAAPAPSLASSGPEAPPMDEGPLEPELSWQDACDGEIGLLCYGVPISRQVRCLRPYHDALRKSCRKALKLAQN